MARERHKTRDRGAGGPSKVSQLHSRQPLLFQPGPERGLLSKASREGDATAEFSILQSKKHTSCQGPVSLFSHAQQQQP